MAIRAPASFVTECISMPVSSPPFCSLPRSWVFSYNSFGVPSSSAIPHHVFLASLKILLFYPINLIPDWPHSLTHLHWLTNLSSPLTSLLLSSFSSGCFMQTKPATFPPMPSSLWLSVQIMHKILFWKKVRIASIQKRIQKLWNMRMKISSISDCY